MGFGGMLASAFAGGAKVIGQQAEDDIAQARKTDMAKMMADIDEQKQLRVAKAAEALRQAGQIADNTGPIADAKLGYQKRVGEQNAQLLTQQEEAAGPIRAKNAGLLATANAEAAAEAAKKNAADPDYLSAVKSLKLADPEVAARLAASRAAVNASNAHSGLLAVQTEGAKLDVADKTKLNKLYDQASEVLTSGDYTNDQARAEAWNKVQKQITLIKSKNGQGAQRDPELDTQTVTEEKINPDGTTTKTTRKEVRRPGQAAEAGAPYADGTQLKGKDGKTYVVKGGVPVLATTEAPAKEPANRPSAKQADSRPVLSQMDAQIAESLQPIADEYRQAKAQLAAVARSGDANALSKYSRDLATIEANLRQEAESRLGNGAQRFLSGIL